MTDDLKRRPSGVAGLAVQDVPPPASKGAKYALVHEPSGGIVGIAWAFQRVGEAKACAQELAELGDWDLAADELQDRGPEAERIVHRCWLAQRPEAKPSKTVEAALGEAAGVDLPAGVFAASGDGRCPCGVAANDPLHPAWHKLNAWNSRIFDAARARRADEFDARLAQHNRRVIVPPATVGR